MGLGLAVLVGVVWRLAVGEAQAVDAAVLAGGWALSVLPVQVSRAPAPGGSG